MVWGRKNVVKGVLFGFFLVSSKKEFGFFLRVFCCFFGGFLEKHWFFVSFLLFFWFLKRRCFLFQKSFGCGCFCFLKEVALRFLRVFWGGS